MKKFIILLIVTFLIGVAPSLIFGSSTGSLLLPKFYPPKIVFPIVWSILYLLMVISLFVATKRTDKPYKIYFEQLIVNSLWTVLFFGLKWRLLSFIWILLLIFLVVKMIIAFYKENKVAGLLQIFYIGWLIIAAYLNLAIFILNR